MKIFQFVTNLNTGVVQSFSPVSRILQHIDICIWSEKLYYFFSILAFNISVVGEGVDPVQRGPS